jgi:tRNA/rRNA methyltransferase
VRIVLHQPRFPENIGAAARAMRNMGLRRLTVVQPENFVEERVRTLATHVAGDVVDAITRHDSLAAALADCQYVVGTTARLGGERQSVVSPPVMARRLVTISQANEVALVFGPEDRGLTNADIRLCHTLVNIPTDAFASLNLAQAVMVMCYEVFTARTDDDGAFQPRLATRHELDGMYDQLRDILVRISYINPENPHYWMNRLRHFGTRLQLRAREVSIIRGIIRQVDWFARKNYEDGLKEGRRRRPAGEE